MTRFFVKKYAQPVLDTNLSSNALLVCTHTSTSSVSTYVTHYNYPVWKWSRWHTRTVITQFTNVNMYYKRHNSLVHRYFDFCETSSNATEINTFSAVLKYPTIQYVYGISDPSCCVHYHNIMFLTCVL